MSVARLTAVSTHQRALAVTASVLPRISCTSYLYVVPIRCISSSLPIVPCTPYSCQVISPRELDSIAEPARDEGERTRLTRAAVVDRALRLADADGMDALTIRKLAGELGVTPMALYWHFRSKDELLEGLAERVWSEIDIAVDRSAPWPAQLRGLLESLLQVLRAHPAAPQLLVQGEKQNEARS